MIKMTSVQRNGVTVVSVGENLDATTSAEATAYFGAEIEKGHANLVIDMSSVTYLSSAGLRVMLTTLQQARKAGGDVRLAGTRDKIRQVMDMTGFLRIIKTFPAADQAVASYTS
jgi:anti-anti-sigma factor